MASGVAPQLSGFAADAIAGLKNHPKRLSARYFYDELGSALFEAITLLPEYGLTRADERILIRHAGEIAVAAQTAACVAELGSGSGRKTRHVLASFQKRLPYFPIDVSHAALEVCNRELSDVADVFPMCADWMDGLRRLQRDGPMLLLFLGSSVGNIDRGALPSFFSALRSELRSGDMFLLGADLSKEIPRMLQAYEDSLGVTAAFNLNVLRRLNSELGADFDLLGFQHEARWNQENRSIEMHLVSKRRQSVSFLDETVLFDAGESIWTESSHKFTVSELRGYAEQAGFSVLNEWLDEEWPFAETLWLAN